VHIYNTAIYLDYLDRLSIYLHNEPAMIKPDGMMAMNSS